MSIDRFIIWLRALANTWNYFVRKSRHRVVNKLAESVLTNMDIVNAIEGAKASARFEREHLLRVPVCKRREDLFRLALSQVPDTGLFLEFGTYKGDSINLLSRFAPRSTFYGFDSFQGLPEGWTAGTREGGLSTHGRVPRVRRNVELIPGFFEDTLPQFLDRHPNAPAAFVHVDCDLYSSTLTVLRTLKPRLQIGTVLVFDEYYNYADWLEGEYKAWTAFCAEYGVGFRYAGYIRMGSQVCVKVTGLPS
jgi:Methyltransferase domain